MFFNFLSDPLIVRASDRVRKTIKNYAKIFGNIMRKNVLIMQKKDWIMRKNWKILWSEVDPLGLSDAFQCAGSNVNTMNTSVLPKILALHSQNKHHFCQALGIWSFSAIRWQVFLHLTQFFHWILREKCNKTSFWSLFDLKLRVRFFIKSQIRILESKNGY